MPDNNENRKKGRDLLRERGLLIRRLGVAEERLERRSFAMNTQERLDAQAKIDELRDKLGEVNDALWDLTEDM